jgi:aminopeptidase YwaD
VTRGIEAARLEADMAWIAGERNPMFAAEHQARVREQMLARLASLGWETRTHEVPSVGYSGVNVVARRAGSTARTWLVGAHYDTVPGSPGADDNGIAVAGLLEIARVLEGSRPRDAIELVAWDLEERDIAGSSWMAREARRVQAPLEGVICLEMIGCCLKDPATQRFPPGMGFMLPDLVSWARAREMRGDFIAIVADERSLPIARALYAGCERAGVPAITVEAVGVAATLPDLQRSDHASFWEHGFPAVMVSDTAEFRNPHYHSAHDTPDTLDYEFAARVVSATVHALETLAGI